MEGCGPELCAGDGLTAPPASAAASRSPGRSSAGVARLLNDTLGLIRVAAAGPSVSSRWAEVSELVLGSRATGFGVSN